MHVSRWPDDFVRLTSMLMCRFMIDLREAGFAAGDVRSFSGPTIIFEDSSMYPKLTELDDES